MTRNSSETRQTRYDSIFGKHDAAPGAAPLVAVDTAPTSAVRRAGRGFARWLRTAAITLGVMYVLGWGAVVGLSSWSASRWWRRFPVNERTSSPPAVPDALVRQRLPVDAAITPEQAGLAFASLLPEPTGFMAREFPPRDVGDRPGVPWRAIPLPREIFAKAQSNPQTGLPQNADVLAMAMRGLTADQRQALRMIAAAPVWGAFDRVARAGAVDLIGGRYQLPFRDGASVTWLPMLPGIRVRDYAYAGMARAAHHLSEGRRDSAEFALRAVVSFALAIRDNTTFRIDRVTANRILDLGANALTRYFELTGDTRGRELAAAVAALGQPAPSRAAPGQRDVESQRRQLFDRLADPTTLLATRFEILRSLNLSACTTAKGVIFGSDDQVRAAFETARRDYARYASERALVDLIANELNAPLSRPGTGVPAGIDLIGRIYFNPRIGACAIGASGPFFY